MARSHTDWASVVTNVRNLNRRDPPHAGIPKKRAELMQPPSKILVVDDEPDLEPLMLQRMRRHIQAGRYTFLFATNGLEALERLNQDKDIDVVISDINVPKMDGLTLLGRIHEIAPHVRSIVISAYDDMKNIRTAMNRGAFDFVTKPIDFGDLHLTDLTLTRHLGVSASLVRSVLAAEALQPHRVRDWKRSADPEFEPKMLAVVGLSLHPPKHAVVLSVDKNTSIQALDPPTPGCS